MVTSAPRVATITINIITVPSFAVLSPATSYKLATGSSMTGLISTPIIASMRTKKLELNRGACFKFPPNSSFTSILLCTTVYAMILFYLAMHCIISNESASVDPKLLKLYQIKFLSMQSYNCKLLNIVIKVSFVPINNTLKLETSSMTLFILTNLIALLGI